MKNRILIAEDEANIRKLVASYLVREGFHTAEASNGREALDQFSAYDDIVLVILDVMMPELDGYEVCREIRRLSQVPVLILTARDTEEDEITGFGSGADEFLSKPFSPAILVTRVKNLLKRTSTGAMSDLTVAGLHIAYRERRVTVDGSTVLLTPKEFDLLYYLVKNQSLVLSRDQILSTVWDMDYAGEDRTVDTHIKCLRAKLGQYGGGIVTVRKVGYKFEWNS